MEKESVKRLAPTKDTLNLLFSLCGNICAFPECGHPVFDPENNLIAQVCHIESANEGGERFNPNSSNEARRLYRNLMVMCYEHHKVTDNAEVYTTEKMRELKSAHENRYRSAPSYVTLDQIDAVYQEELQKSVQKISSDTDKILQNQNEELDILRQVLSNQKGVATEKVGTNSSFDKQIDSIISLRSKNQHKASVSLFEQLKAAHWDELSQRERYRIQANLGILHLDLIENDKAACYFIDAFKFQPDDPKAMGWAILGYSLRGEEKQAQSLIENGLRIDPLNVGIYSSIIRFKSGLPLPKILELIPSELKQHSEIAYELSRVCQMKGNYSTAITWAQVALDSASDSKYELRAVLATTILESISRSNLVISSQVSLDTRNKAQYIVDLYTLAWDEVKYTDLHESRTWFLINRAVAKTYLGDMEGCYQDAKEALAHKRESFALRHVAISAMRTGREQEAFEIIAELKAFLNGSDLAELRHFEAQLYLQVGQGEDGISLMEQMLEEEIDLGLRFFIIEFFSQYYLEKGDIDSAAKYNKTALLLDPTALSPMVLNGKIALAQDDKVKAISIFKNTLALIDEKTKEVDIYDLSLEFEKLGMFTEGISLLERISDTDNYSPNTKKLLQLYYNSGLDAKLLSTSKNLISKFGPIPYVTELKSYVFEKINDFASAIDTCLQHLKVYPNDQHVQIRLALIYSKMEDWENASAIAAGIGHIDRTLSMELQFKLAMLCHDCGDLGKFQSFAYETRRHFQNSVSAHENFINLGTTFSREEERQGDPTEVGIDCYVVVANGDDIVSYLIEDRKDLSRIKGEISPSSAEAIALKGRKIGDPVVFGGQDYIVKEIYHKFNAAMRESFRLISTTFAPQTSFRKFTIGKTGNFEHDFKPLFQNLDANSEWEENIEAFYRQGNVPLSTISRIKKRNLIKTWGIYISDENLGLRTTSDKAEVVKAFSELEKRNSILFDLISLLTIAQLNCFDEIELLEGQRYVAQSTVLEINELIRELKGSRKTGSMSIGKKNGRYTSQVSSPEEIQSYIDHLTKLVKWIKQKCRSLPCTAALKLNGEEKKRLDEAVGESTIDSILTAEEHHYLLYAEDAVVRSLALMQNGITGMATFICILYLHLKKKISNDRYINLSIDLIGLNYRHIPVDSHILLACATKTKYKYEYPLTYVTKSLNADLMEDGVMLEVVCNYFIGLYKQPVNFIFDRDIKDLRHDIIVNTLEILKEKFKIKLCLQPILQILQLRLGAADVDYLTIATIVNDFCRYSE